MGITWGYSPKIEKYIPLGEFPADKYLVVVAQVIENLGWNISHVSAGGIIAYTPISFQSYSEEISIKIENNFAIVKSECVGIQMWFNDYGKNAVNLEKFFHEFEYVEFHLKDVWEESLEKFHEFVRTQDPEYFEKAPLTAKNKIKNVVYLFVPQQNYRVTPLLIILNVVLFIFKSLFSFVYLSYVMINKETLTEIENVYFYLGGNNRELILNNQYWRLISHQFVHASFFHLFFNMYALAYIGLMVEHKLGVRKYLTIYLLSGICGGVLSLLFHLEVYMVGASGAIMGLFGAFIALLLNNAFEKNATRALLISTVSVTLLMLLSGLRGNTDNAAHIGGLVSGFLITYILFNEKLLSHKLTLQIRYVIAFIIVFLFVGSTLAFAPNYQNKAFNKLERAYQQNIFKYMEIYSIKRSHGKQRQLQLLKKNGINSWAKNDSLVKEMNQLVLNKDQRAQVEFHQKMISRHKLLVNLFYKQTLEDDQIKYRNQIENLYKDIDKVRSNSKSKIGTRY